MSHDLARCCSVEESPSKGKAGVGRINGSRARQHLMGSWGNARSAEVNKELLTGISRMV